MDQPPSRKRAKRAAKPKAKKEEPTIEALVARCSRSALEALALKHASRADIEECMRANSPPPPPVIGDDRVGTGAFDVVDGECFSRILHYLPATARYPLAMMVCKSWLRLRAAPGLWTSFHGNGAPWVLNTNAKGAAQLPWGAISGFGDWQGKQYSTNQPAVLTTRLTSFQLNDKISWFLNKDAVVELGLSTGDYGNSLLSSDSVITAFNAFPNIRSLALDGKQILTKVFKSRPSWLASLETLVVGNQVPTAGKKAFAGFLGRAVKLETLCVESSLATYETLELAVEEIRDARGGDPLLSNLRLYGLACDQYSVPSVCGRWFPNLISFSFCPGAYRWQRWDDGGAPSFCAIPRLRELRIDGMATYDTHFDGDRLASLMACALPAAPILEKLTLLHGQVSKRDKPPFPEVGSSLSSLPVTLTELVLSDVVLKPGDLSINSLETLRVRNVGGGVKDSFKKLVASLPAVDVEEFAFRADSD